MKNYSFLFILVCLGMVAIGFALCSLCTALNGPMIENIGTTVLTHEDGTIKVQSGMTIDGYSVVLVDSTDGSKCYETEAYLPFKTEKTIEIRVGSKGLAVISKNEDKVKEMMELISNTH